MRPAYFPDDPQFWVETLRSFGYIAYGGADFGEVAVTAARIAPSDYDSWHDQSLATAERVVRQAESALARGHRISARDAFLRASNYYRNAEFFPHGNSADPHSPPLRPQGCLLQNAARLFNPATEPIEIPFEHTTLPGYLYRADATGTARPTLVTHNGIDGSVEEMHFFGAAATVEHGFTALTFDGPGQPGVRHRRGLVLRPDWENVAGPVLDYALTLPEVAADQVALLGVSHSGVLAPRAAAFEHRVAALIAVDGVYDVGATVTAHMPADRDEAERRRQWARVRPHLRLAGRTVRQPVGRQNQEKGNQCQPAP